MIMSARLVSFIVCPVAMFNSPPIGFYSPSQLVQDAACHGVTVLP